MADTQSAARAEVVRMPEPGHWTIDSVHSWVAFTLEHFTVAFARGIAAGPRGVIVVAGDVSQSTVPASIDVSTLTTANSSRDEKITGPDGAGEWGHRALLSGGFMVPDAVSITLEIEATLDITEDS